ncbi:MAG TPA: hypothetical protein VHV51_12255 [Polyangiaceae bacterium]|jgi:hypothetical protein|nr:hypothetical protein [Polyangiaceae bacterium]
MTTDRIFPRLARYAALALALIALSCFGAFSVHTLRVEAAQARSLVAESQSALKNGDRAAAVLAAERARLLAPRADFVRSALDRAHVRAVDSPLDRAVTWLAPREWSFLLVSFGWAAGLGLAGAIALGKTSSSARRFAFAASALFALSAVGFVQSSHSSRSLAVVSSATGLLVAPYAGSGASADLATGVVVSVGARYGDFARVRAPEAARGWVSMNALESVIGS